MTYVEIIQQLFGKWIGWIVGAGFVILCLTSVPQISWFMSYFITLQAMPGTPSYAVNLVFVVTIITALLYGLETIVRAYEIFIYFISSLFILAMVLVLPNARIENLLPVFEKGITPILKGSFVLSSTLLLPVIILLMIYPCNADNTSEAKKSFLKGYLWGAFLVFISIIMSILVLGSTITANSQYPLYLLAKEINVGIIFTRLEFLIAAVWMFTLLARGILYFYTGIIGFSQLLGLKDHKKIILPMGLIVLVVSQVTFPNSIYQADWDTFTWTPFVVTFCVILPIILILVFLIKKWVFKMDMKGK